MALKNGGALPKNNYISRPWTPWPNLLKQPKPLVTMRVRSSTPAGSWPWSRGWKLCIAGSCAAWRDAGRVPPPLPNTTAVARCWPRRWASNRKRRRWRCLNRSNAGRLSGREEGQKTRRQKTRRQKTASSRRPLPFCLLFLCPLSLCPLSLCPLSLFLSSCPPSSGALRHWRRLAPSCNSRGCAC